MITITPATASIVPIIINESCAKEPAQPNLLVTLETNLSMMLGSASSVLSSTGIAVHLAYKVISASIAVLKSNASVASAPAYQPSKVNPSFSGAVGSVAVLPAFTCCASISVPPSVLKVTVNTSIHLA